MVEPMYAMGKAVRLDYYMQMTRDALDAGCGGVTMGRWVWDNDDVTALVIALRRLIHKGYTAKECMELYKTVKSEKNYGDYDVLK